LLCGILLVGWRLFLFGSNIARVWFGGLLLVFAATGLLVQLYVVGWKHVCNEIGEVRSNQQQRS
jgi:hypothetical protein